LRSTCRACGGFVNSIENLSVSLCHRRPALGLPGNVQSDREIENAPGAVGAETALAELKAAVDLTVEYEGLFTYVFRPNHQAGIGPQEIVEVIEYAVEKHGSKVKFLNAREVTERLTKHALSGHSLSATDGTENGVRLLDVNADGFMDVVVGNADARMTRLWNPVKNAWDEVDGLPVAMDSKVRFGVIGKSGFAAAACNGRSWEFNGANWEAIAATIPAQDAIFRDLDGDGICEWIGGNVFRRLASGGWEKLPFTPPSELLSAGSRLIDLDFVSSNAEQYSVGIFDSLVNGWSGVGKRGRRGTRPAGQEIPPIIRSDGSDNGSWFHGQSMVWQNEDSVRGGSQIVTRRFEELLAEFATVLNSRPLEPGASLAVIHLNPKFKIQLAASEPVVMDPIDIAWGADGKVWVVEMADYPLGMDGKGKPGGRVRWLQDADTGGRFERSTVFLDELQTPTGVMPWCDGVLVLAPPELIYAEDRDGDGVADYREVILTGFVEGNQQHRVNGLRWGLDNWVYIANGDSGGEIRSNKTGQSIDIRGRDLRIRPDTGEIEAQTGQTQYGRNRDDWGNWFGCSNANLMWHFALADHYIGRNPHVAPPDPTVNLYRGPGRLPVFPKSAALERFNGPAELNLITSACGANLYRDEEIGGQFYHNAFICEPVHNLVNRELLAPDGVTFSAQRPPEERASEFLASEDHWFRPVSVRTGPDGTLWIADMYRLVIEHPEWIPEDWEERLDLRAGQDRGRIYRVLPTTARARPLPVLNGMSAIELVAMLESRNGPTRDLVQQLLTWRESISDEAIAALERLAQTSQVPVARMQALSTLDGIGKLSKAAAHRGLIDPHPGVRRHAMRLCENFDSSPPNVAELARDEDAHVRLQTAYSLGEWSDDAAGAALADLALNHAKGDRFIEAAALSSAMPHLGTFLSVVLGNPNASDSLRDAALRTAAAHEDKPKLIARVLAARHDAVIDAHRLFDVGTMLAAIGGKASGVEELRPLLVAARTLLANSSQGTEAHLAAIGVLAYSNQADDGELLKPFLSTDRRLDLQRAAVEALAAGDLPNSESILADYWQEVSPSLRTTIATRLCSTKTGSNTILDRIESKPELAAVLPIAMRELLLSNEDEAQRDRVTKLLPAPAERLEILGPYLAAQAKRGLLAAKTDNGRDVFQRNCTPCHVVDGIGQANIGPDLQAITDRSPESLITAILDPNRAVEDKFATFLVTSKTGEVMAGAISTETATSLELNLPDGLQRSILRKDIASVASTGRSLMPEGFEAAITTDEMSDLIAWLSMPRQPRREFPDNEPKRIAADDNGVAELEGFLMDLRSDRISPTKEKTSAKVSWHAEGSGGAVAAEAPAAVEAGISILKGGGNAADAAVAVLMAASVADYGMFAMGAEVPFMIYDAKKKEVKTLSGLGGAPLDKEALKWYYENEIPEQGGIRAVPVPGAVSLFVTALQKYGTVNFVTAVEPTLQLLDAGGQEWYDALAVTLRKLVQAEAQTEGTREEKLQAARDRFYKGDIAEQLVVYYKKEGGFLRMRDLDAHQTLIEDPVSVDYRGYTVLKCGPWTQGPYLCQTLQILEGFDLKTMGHLSSDYIHVLAESLKLGLADRDFYYGDPRFVKLPMEGLLSDRYGKLRQSLVDMKKASLEVRPGDPIKMKALVDEPGKYRPGPGGTTTCVVADRWGNFVAATPSGNRPYNVCAPLGVAHGNRLRSLNTTPGHPNRIEPGKRPRITLTPTLVLKDGTPILGISVAGGDLQDQTTLNCLLNFIEFDMMPKVAVSTSRFFTRHHENSFVPGKVRDIDGLGKLTLNDKIPEEVRDNLARRGHEISTASGAIAAPVMVYFDKKTGRFQAAGDPRAKRHAAVLEEGTGTPE
jgi:putative membrane-bound dehydrogenase-like protein